MAKILVIEDDKMLSEVVREHLKGDHHNVEIAETGTDAVEMLDAFKFDVILLDWDLPGISGIQVLSSFRKNGGTTPVLMLTHRGSIDEKEAGFDAGSDDYLAKPFSLRELSSRIKALLRRSPNLTANVLKIADIELNPSSHHVTKSGAELKLFPMEFALLEFLMRHPKKVFSVRELMSHVWSSDSESTEEAVYDSARTWLSSRRVISNPLMWNRACVFDASLYDDLARHVGATAVLHFADPGLDVFKVLSIIKKVVFAFWSTRASGDPGVLGDWIDFDFNLFAR
jgi:DNA-binding response OmpR family regulator